jgi:hypothetical protein
MAAGTVKAATASEVLDAAMRTYAKCDDEDYATGKANLFLLRCGATVEGGPGQMIDIATIEDVIYAMLDAETGKHFWHCLALWKKDIKTYANLFFPKADLESRAAMGKPANFHEMKAFLETLDMSERTGVNSALIRQGWASTDEETEGLPRDTRDFMNDLERLRQTAVDKDFAAKDTRAIN